MAETPSPATQNSNSNQAEHQNPTPQSNQPDSVPPKEHVQPTQSTPPPLPPPPSISMSVNSSSNPTLVSPPPPSVSYAHPPASYSPVMLPSVPSFRPFPQFTPFPNPAVLNPNFQNPSVQTSSFQPPGVTLASSMAPVAVSGALGGSSTAATSVPPQPLMSYQVTAAGQPPNPALRPYALTPNGCTPLPGLPRYAPPYPMMLRPGFPPRPPGAMGVMPTMARPSVPAIPGVRPIIPPVIRPVVPSVTPAEKPQTTVYVGKIAPSVENDFMLSLLQLCGPVKSWKRAQHPSNGTSRGFGFCEFESAEGVLRALRLLSKLNIDWQELVLNVNQATREYLERYVEKKIENSKKVKENDAATAVKENDAAEGVEKTDISNPSVVESKEDRDSGNKENDTTTFGIVTEEDREADRQAREKLASMIEERLKTKPPPPPPPPPPAQVSDNGAGGSELLAKPKDGDSDADITRNVNDAADEKIDDDTTSDTKQGSEHDRPETSSPDKSRRDRRSRDKDRDRERDLKREKEREIERYERETERERIRKEREQRRKIEEAERQYVECLKDWEYRERDKEKQRQYEKEKEKERESKRKKEVFYEEEDNDDDSRKRWRRSVLEDRRKKRLREREDDLADSQKEEEEIAEAMRRAEEEKKLQLQKLALKDLDEDIVNESEKATVAAESSAEYKDKSVEQNYEGYPDHGNHKGDSILQNGRSSDELNVAPVAAVDNQQSSNATTKKLGFGLVGSGKRTAVPSVFHEEDDEDARKEKRMRPLVPIDYSTEELQAVQPTVSGAPQPNLAAATEFAKRISNSSKEERSDSGKERNRRTSDRSSQRERERNDEDVNRPRDEKEDHVTEREHAVDRLKTSENKKLLDAKQLIDMIPRTKEELFSYEINWAIYDKHGLHERMRPWISKKITEFLGEEETTLVDYIVSSTQEHLEAERMLQLLQSILDEEAEMFVLKMWRMLIFEIKKVETGLASKPKT